MYFIFISANTHVHADHVTGTGELKKLIPSCKSIISLCSGAKADIYVKAGDEIQFGRYSIEVRLTPGHTNGKKTIQLCHMGHDIFLLQREVIYPIPQNKIKKYY